MDKKRIKGEQAAESYATALTHCLPDFDVLCAVVVYCKVKNVLYHFIDLMAAEVESGGMERSGFSGCQIGISGVTGG